MWLIFLTLLIIFAFSLKRLNETYYILALCKRVKTNDGSKLSDRIFTLRGRTIFGNNFDILNKTPSTLFKYSRDNYALAKGKSYLQYFIITTSYNVVTAEDAEAILQSQILISKSVIYDLAKPFLGDGLLISTDKKWHFRRKLLTPAFHFNILQNFLDIFKEETAKFINNLDKQKDQIITLKDVIPKFALNSVCETAIGVNLDNIPGSEAYRQSIHKIEQLCVERLCNPLLHNAIIYYIWGNHREFQRNVQIAHNFSSNIIKRKREEWQQLRKEQQQDCNVIGRKQRYAFLDTLLHAESEGFIDHRGICDEVNTFMFEGFDTTASCLIGTLLNLAWHQDIQEKCYAEVANLVEYSSVFDYNNLMYLECVIKETLRLYPSVPFVGRTVTTETHLNGLTFSPGMQIFIHIIDIMRDAKHFPDPLKFIPERFLPEHTTNRHPFAFVAFSAGPRNCIGQKFAMLEMKVLLVAILQNFQLLPITKPEDIVFEYGLVLRTQQDCKVKLVKRIDRLNYFENSRNKSSNS